MKLPVRSGYLEGLAGYSWLDGPFVEGRLGGRLADNVSAYAFAEWNQREPMAGLGVKVEFP